MRTSMTVILIATFAMGCAGGSRKRGERLDYCTCDMWGVTGVDPGPDSRPPPRPVACKRILKRANEEDCPIPP
jgi:hypothetical protein